MNGRNFFQKADAGTPAVINTVLGTVVGPIGAAILKHSVSEGARIGFFGGAAVGLAGEMLHSALNYCGIFKSIKKCCPPVTIYVADLVAISAVGYEIVKTLDPNIIISLMDALKSVLVGGGVISPVFCCLLACLSGYALTQGNNQIQPREDKETGAERYGDDYIASGPEADNEDNHYSVLSDKPDTLSSDLYEEPRKSSNKYK